MIRQGRFYTGLAILCMFIFLCAIGSQMRMYRFESRGRHQLHGHNISQVINTVSFSVHCLPPAMDVLFPILTGIFCAAIFAGEFENKHVRTMAMRPISRTNMYLGKLGAMLVYIFFFFLLLWGLSFITGLLLFENDHDVYIWGKTFNRNYKGYILPQQTAWTHYFLIYLMAPLTLVSLVSIFLMFSVIFKKFTSAATLPVGIYFVSLALEQMPIFSPIRNYLPSYYCSFWKYLAHPTIPWQNLIHSVVVMLLFAVAALAAGIFLFKSSDI